MDVLDRLLSYAPPLYRDSQLWAGMMKGEAKEFARIEEILEDVGKQLSVDTATWGLSFYEAEYGIDPPVDATLEERRQAIKAMMRGGGTFTHDKLMRVIEAYVEKAEVRYDIPNHVFEISIIRPFGIPKLDENLRQAVSELKPAHLGFIVLYAFFSWGYVKEKGLTWGDVKGISWSELRRRGVEEEE